jgi:hypothetical protein
MECFFGPCLVEGALSFHTIHSHYQKCSSSKQCLQRSRRFRKHGASQHCVNHHILSDGRQDKDAGQDPVPLSPVAEHRARTSDFKLEPATVIAEL